MFEDTALRGQSLPRRTSSCSKVEEEEDDAGPALCIPRGFTTRTLLINQIEVASTEDVVHEGQHDADDDDEACLGKRSCL